MYFIAVYNVSKIALLLTVKVITLIFLHHPTLKLVLYAGCYFFGGNKVFVSSRKLHGKA